ncbi:MAG TPA: sugar ABC transporter permease [Chloroflexia bacterium]|jgi:multiple sugar transport system permease protein|nr:sugar ABC transporter permease [Chloroflexia bacterium]
MATQVQAAPSPKAPGMSRKASEALHAYLFVAPWIILSIVFTFGAMIYVFYLSFTNLRLFNTPEFIGLTNYTAVLQNKLFWTAVQNTLAYAVVVTFFQTWLALILAVILNAKIPGKQFFRIGWYIPSVTSSVVISLVFVWVFFKQGILNYVLVTLFGWTGFQPVAWLTDAGAHTALPALMLLNISTTAPTFMLYFLAALQDIPEEIYEAASLDGAVGVARFFKITVPMLRPIIFLVVVLGTIGTLQLFDQALIMTAGGPLNQTTTINLLIYQAAFTNSEMARASAMAFILFVLIFVLFLVQRRFLGNTNQ